MHVNSPELSTNQAQSTMVITASRRQAVREGHVPMHVPMQTTIADLLRHEKPHVYTITKVYVRSTLTGGTQGAILIIASHRQTV